MPDQFFCESLKEDLVVLPESEARHVHRVLRMSAGDAIQLFDGSGVIADARIVVSERRTVSAQILIRHPLADPHPLQSLTVAAAMPRGPRQKQLLEKLTELGVGRFIPMITERTVAVPKEGRADKLRDTILAACKQSRRATLLKLEPPQQLTELIGPGNRPPGGLFFAHPGIDTSTPRKATSASAKTLLIGPEGGFTPEEADRISDAGGIPVSWPGTILRIETAAVVFSTLLASGQPELPG